MNVIEKILDYLKTSEKNMLIKQSGSTPDGKYEKVRSGQSYLYKKRGMESEVIEIRFVKDVIGGCLGQALCETMKRYPYFNTKLIEKDGDFYIVQNPVQPTIRKSNKLANLGGIGCGYHLFDVTYFGKSIFVSFHHALCDGRGIKPFIETLIWYYCKYRFNSVKKIEGVRLATDGLLSGETADPFIQAYEYDETKEYISLPRDAFALPHTNTENAPDIRYEITFSSDEFMRVCKENNATPVILVALSMSKAIAQLYPDYGERINANIATDMRAALNAENTFKNCVKTMILPFDRDIAELTLKEQSTKYREILNAQRDYDYCRRETKAMLGLFDKLDSLPTFEEKQKIMSFFEEMSINTYVISYLGQFTVGSNAKYIEEIHLYNSGADGLGVNMICCGDKFIIDIKQSFASDEYVQAFVKELTALGIVCQCSKAIEFETPNDKLIKRK